MALPRRPASAARTPARTNTGGGKKYSRRGAARQPSAPESLGRRGAALEFMARLDGLQHDEAAARATPAQAVTQAAAKCAVSALTWAAQAVLTLALALVLVQRGALAAPTSGSSGSSSRGGVWLPQLDRWQRPGINRLHEERSVSDDLSAAVRIYRGDEKSIDVWMITPLSSHWNEAVARAPQLSTQLANARWSRDGDSEMPRRFQRIATTLQSRSDNAKLLQPMAAPRWPRPSVLSTLKGKLGR